MKFIKGFIEAIELILVDDKKSHAGKKAGGALAKKSLKKLKPKRLW